MGFFTRKPEPNATAAAAIPVLGFPATPLAAARTAAPSSGTPAWLHGASGASGNSSGLDTSGSGNGGNGNPTSAASGRDPQASLPQAKEIIGNFSQVPSFLRLLTTGEHPVYALSAKDQECIVALECQGQQACVLHAQGADRGTLEALRGTLISKGYTMLPSLQAHKSVMKELVDSDKQQVGGAMRLAVNAYQETVKTWIQYAVQQRATDIHIAVQGNTGTVKCRIDGEIEPLRNASLGQYPADFLIKVVSDLYNFGQKEKSGSGSVFKDDAFQYCMIPYNETGHPLNLRFQATKGDKGPKVVLRLLDINPNAATRSYAELGYAPSQQRLWETIQSTPSGAVIIAGITGSGKTTTQKTVIEAHARSGAWYTIEDPVEYPIRGAHQIPIQRDLANEVESSKRYREAVTAVMRLDPDGVMVGEIRDTYSANALRQIAETGHVALGTLHAHLLSGIVPRLTNPEIGISRETLAAPNMLTALVYQALVPQLCGHCALDTREAVATLPGCVRVERQAAALGVDTALLRWKRG